MNEWITFQEAVKRTGRSEGWLRRRIRLGRLTTTKKLMRRHWRVMLLASEIERIAHEDDRGGFKEIATKRSAKPARPKLDDEVMVRRGILGGSLHKRPDRGRVKGLYKRFAVIEFPQGYTECFDYHEIEVVKGRRKN